MNNERLCDHTLFMRSILVKRPETRQNMKVKVGVHLILGCHLYMGEYGRPRHSNHLKNTTQVLNSVSGLSKWQTRLRSSSRTTRTGR